MKTLLRWALAAALLSFGSTGWGQNIYNKFSPATGVLKGSATSYFTTAAASSDIRGLWTGTCDATTFLRGDGSCAAALATVPGSNTQVIYNNSGALGASSLLTFNSGSDVLNIGASTTPGTFSVGTLDSMVVNGVSVPIPSFAANSNIQGVFENHSYVNGVSSGGARYYGVRSEGTISSPSIVANGDHLSTFYAAGYNGSSYSLGGSLTFLVDGTPGASAMPSDLDIALSPAGSQTPGSILKLYGTGSYGVNGSQGNAGNSLLSGGTGPAAWGAINLASINGVTGTLGVTNGGSGLATATLGDLHYGSGTNTLAALAGNTTATKKYLTQTGTGTVSAAPGWNTIASADVISGWTGTCSSGTFLRGDGACAAAGGGTVTSITAGTGLTGGTITTTGTIALSTPVAVANGGTGTASPGLVAGTNVTITGTWPNQTVNSTASGGTPAGATTQVQYNNASAFGANSGFTYNGSGTINVTTDVQIGGVSVCQSNGTNCPTASTTASVTSTGCTGNSAVNGYFAKSGNVATLTVSAFACTSNSTLFTFTGFPAAYQPTHQASCAALVEDNTVDGKVGSIVIAASGTISLTVASSSGGSWTASGIKGFNNAITCSYPLN